MSPKLVSDDGRYVVIRPLAYFKESDLAQFAQDQGYPIIPYNLCGCQPNPERAEIKAMLADWEKRYPGRVEDLFRSLRNIVPSHLMDAELYPFDSPSPNELLDYRSENPLDEASEIREVLAEAELNPCVEVRSDTDLMIQMNSTVI